MQHLWSTTSSKDVADDLAQSDDWLAKINLSSSFPALCVDEILQHVDGEAHWDLHGDENFQEVLLPYKLHDGSSYSFHVTNLDPSFVELEVVPPRSVHGEAVCVVAQQ